MVRHCQLRALPSTIGWLFIDTLCFLSFFFFLNFWFFYCFNVKILLSIDWRARNQSVNGQSRFRDLIRLISQFSRIHSHEFNSDYWSKKCSIHSAIPRWIHPEPKNRMVRRVSPADQPTLQQPHPRGSQSSVEVHNRPLLHIQQFDQCWVWKRLSEHEQRKDFQHPRHVDGMSVGRISIYKWIKIIIRIFIFIVKYFFYFFINL